jgi:hypothetical protein
MIAGLPAEDAARSSPTSNVNIEKEKDKYVKSNSPNLHRIFTITSLLTYDSADGR